METHYKILARRLGGLTLGVSGLGLAMGASPSGPLRYGRETYRWASVTPTASWMFIKYVCPPSISRCPEVVRPSLFIAHVDEINANIRNKFHRSFVGVVRRCWKGDSEVDRVRVTLVRESVTFSTTIVLSSGRDSNAKVALQC